MPHDTRGYRFIRTPLVRGERYYRKLLPTKPTVAVIEWLHRIQLWIWWRAVRPDIVHVNYVADSAYHLAKAKVKPLVLTVWGGDVNQHFFADADEDQRRRAGIVLRHADAVIIDSPEMAEKCAKLAGKIVRTELLPLGIDTNLFRPGYREAALAWRKKLEIPANSMVIVSMRALQKGYGHDAILDAFAQALPSLGGEAILLFRRYNLNETENYEAYLRKRSDYLGISRHIRWMDLVPYEQLPEVYALADLVINYPLFDAFPVTFMEAAACGRPVVSCHLPAYAGTFAEEFFQMTSPQDVEKLAGAIIRQLSHPISASTELLIRARRVVERCFNESVSSGKLLHLYKDVENGFKGDAICKQCASCQHNEVLLCSTGRSQPPCSPNPAIAAARLQRRPDTSSVKVPA